MSKSIKRLFFSISFCSFLSDVCQANEPLKIFISNKEPNPPLSPNLESIRNLQFSIEDSKLNDGILEELIGKFSQNVEIFSMIPTESSVLKPNEIRVIVRFNALTKLTFERIKFEDIFSLTTLVKELNQLKYFKAKECLLGGSESEQGFSLEEVEKISPLHQNIIHFFNNLGSHQTLEKIDLSKNKGIFSLHQEVDRRRKNANQYVGQHKIFVKTLCNNLFQPFKSRTIILDDCLIGPIVLSYLKELRENNTQPNKYKLIVSLVDNAFEPMEVLDFVGSKQQNTNIQIFFGTINLTVVDIFQKLQEVTEDNSEISFNKPKN